jgi:hypothetical protein
VERAYGKPPEVKHPNQIAREPGCTRPERKIAMKRKLVPLVACLLLLGLAVTAQADVIYTFTTTSPAPGAGPINGSFTVPNSAITKGFLQSGDIDSFNFTAPGPTSPPFPVPGFVWNPGTTPASFGDVLGTIPVDPVTGVFEPPFGQNAEGFVEIVGFQGPVPYGFFLVATGPNTGAYLPSIFGQSSQGSGTFAVSTGNPVSPPNIGIPEPSSILLFSFAGISGLVYLGIRRRSRLRLGNP